jgi:DNA polymerase (family 10)
MDPRTAASVLTGIAEHLQLAGAQRFKSRAYETAARALLGLDTDDIGALDRTGALAAARGIGPATLAVLRDLIGTGESRYLAQLRAGTPEGLLALLHVPGLAPERIALIHETLGVDSLDSLEAAARDGRLATVKGLGPKGIARILKGIDFARRAGTRQLYPRAIAAAQPLLQLVLAHPGVQHAQLAGSLRRHGETPADVDIVAVTASDPAAVANDFARSPGVREVAFATPGSPAITYMDGARLDLHLVPERDFAIALWRATGNDAHVAGVRERLAARGFVLEGDRLRDARGVTVPVSDEAAIYGRAGMALVPPQMREGRGEIDRAATGPIPALIELADLRGVLHCHSTWSDGRATIAEMAAAARVRGWQYIGITDHSQAAFYAGGMSPERVAEQHDEIDALNVVQSDVRILKGIEADILPDGRIDYDEAVLARFDFVIGSVHSRFAMERTAMTDRVLRALDSPFLTVLLSRDAYAIDLDAVLAKAGAVGVAVELNADPHRLDLDWRMIPAACAAGAVIEIGPDAHSTTGLDNVAYGVGIARKAGLSAAAVLNTRSADDILAFARARREGRR